ncbi:BRE1 [Mytilus coruscus]|uniref:E3 ubiquitin protein ligase n=1 Tax=Mytilus coruscus TaxID=42192 RepID=A0A6J8CCP3_MYTCO|nr:BRE1 [Mytilus coruscus]
MPHIELLTLHGNELELLKQSIVENVSSMRELYLDGNNIHVINEKSFQSYLLKSLHVLELSGNQFQCTCEIKWFLDTIRSTNLSIKLKKNWPKFYICHYPDNLQKSLLADYFPTTAECNPLNIVSMIIITACSSVLLLLVCVIMTFNCQINIKNVVYLFRLKQRIKNGYFSLESSNDFEFDAFVVYCDADRLWVHGVLLKHLENSNLNICVHHRDFDVGDTIMNNIGKYMAKSWKIIVVLSNNFAKSEWCQWEIDLLMHLPEEVIVDTTEYKCLQSQFSVLYNDALQIRTSLSETRNLLMTSKNTHLRHLEQLESDELDSQKRLRAECIQLEDALAQVRKEYEMLRIEFEQTLAQNEQTGPINQEMRNLIQSLQKHNQQLKAESSRNRRRYKETLTELNKLKAEVAAAEQKSAENSAKNSQNAPGSKEVEGISATPSVPKTPGTPTKTDTPELTSSSSQDKDDDKDEFEYREKGKTDIEVIKELRTQLKISQASQRELKLLLDMYKSAPKEQRDKTQLMGAEKKLRHENEDLKVQLKRMQENEKRDRRKLAEDEAILKIIKMEKTISELSKNLSTQKQREEALLNEMEVTGQAFEDMQEQNLRLMQQLKEKDDANFKLMSERIKSNQIQKLLREEKEVLAEQVATLQTQVEAQMLVVRNLEEKEQVLQNALSTAEKELGFTQQSMEMHKRKAVESSQTAADLKLHLDKYQAQLKEAQVSVAEKTGALEQQSFKRNRLQEEIAKLLQRKLERSKKIEMAGAADEVLMAEIAEYKEQLTCPSCKVNRKDAVLTKCFHVFCLECLKTRYETRQRKCPKCNAGFGANDYHRLYIS